MRTNEEKNYWDKAAEDPAVDRKYISDIPNEGFLEMLGDPTGKVLEIGCGVGRLMKDGWCGIDISPAMLEIARKRKPQCEFKLTDGRTIPYPDKTFDFVYSVLVFQHIPLEAVEAYTKETSRVLKSGGQFVFQFIEGTEDEPFSKHHDQGKIFDFLMGNDLGNVEISYGAVHPQWIWLRAIKK